MAETTACGRGPDWFRELYVAHHANVLAFAQRRVPDVADDVVSEVFGVAWRQRDQVPHSALPWLYATARHVVLHQQRSHARRQRLIDRLGREPQQTPSSTDQADTVTTAQAQVRRMLARLPQADAEVLRLWAWEELDGADLAAALGCSPAAARVRLHRAKRRAAQLLDLSSISEILTLSTTLGDLR